jgi:hypothetical protein
MKKRFRFICCLLLWNGLSIAVIDAQDLTGIWRGHFRSNDGVERLVETYDGRYKIYDDRYKMEVQIAQSSNRFEAITYSYKNTEFYGKAEATGSLNIQSKKVLLKEGKLLEVRFANGTVCLMTCFMQYSKLGDDEYLQGTYYSVSVNDSLSGCGKGSIFLHRVTESDFHKEPFLEKKEKELLAHKNPTVPPKAKSSLPAVSAAKPVAKTKKPANTKPVPAASVPLTAKNSPPKKPPVKKQPAGQSSKPLAVQKSSAHMEPDQGRNTRDSSLKIYQPQITAQVPNVLKTRTNEVLKTLTVNHSSIEIRIYDDGAIDNDTVSVYYDNKLIISKVRLTDQAISMRIAVEPSDRPHQLVMVAENLGEIPPNTSLLVVRDGEKIYEERIISTEQKNVQLNFIYKKIE